MSTKSKNNSPREGISHELRSAETWRERRAGLMMAAIGVFAAVTGAQYGVGTLDRIGPGFFPTALGVGLMLIGIAIALTAHVAQDGSKAALGHITPYRPVDWRGWVAIVAGILLFILVTPLLGLVPGTFACVFTSAMGDRKMTLLSSAVLAAVVSAAGALLFVWGLRVGLPYFGS